MVRMKVMKKVSEEVFYVPEKLLNMTFWDSNRKLISVYYGEPDFAPFLAINPTELSFKRVIDWGIPSKELSNPYLRSFAERWGEQRNKPLTFHEFHELMEDINFLIERIPYIENSFIEVISEFDRRQSNIKGGI